MGKRREGREAAVQFLYQRDLNPEVAEPKVAAPAGEDAVPEAKEGSRDGFWAMLDAKKATRDFCEGLVQGVLEHREEIDGRITKYSANYELGRIAAVDRNVLRVAIYEMLYCEEIPPVVSINEAIEIAKRFGSEESGRFVNGILDRVRLELARPARTAAGA